MTVDLDSLIVSAEQLSFTEQIELLRALSQSLAKKYLPKELVPEFWKVHSIENIVNLQKTSPVENISTLKLDFWQKEENTDDFIAYIYQQREEDALVRE